MLRLVGLALVLVAGSATPAGAEVDLSGGSALAAQHGDPVGRAAQHLDRKQALAPEWDAPAATTPQALRGRGFGPRWQVVDGARGVRRLSPERRQRQDAMVLPWRGQGRSAVALPLTERWAVGLGYRHIRGEDLWQQFTEIGSTDYESHNLLLRAHWRF
jgi:hypothetical protein